MKKILTIGLYTLKEIIRDKILYSLLGFAVLMLCFSMVLGNLALGQPEKIIKDFGLGAISIIGTLIAVFIGISSLFKESDRKTIYVILSKPLSRWQFLTGKYLGLSMIITFEVGIMLSCLFALLVFVYDNSVPWDLFYAVIPIWFEIHLILAVAVFFSSFSTSFLSGMFTLSIFVIGHTTTDLRMLLQTSEDVVLKQMATVIFYVFPNLDKLNYTSQVVHSIDIPFFSWVGSLVYSVCYTAILLIIASLLFQRKDVK